MTDILEKIARAIEDAMASDDNHPHDIARAALLAMREPDSETVLVGCKEIEDADMGPEPWIGPYDIWIPAARQSFTAMIDAILKEGGDV